MKKLDQSSLPQVIEWQCEEKNLVPFVISLNLHRRHLNESQRAMVANKIANLSNGQRASQICEAVTQSDAATLLNISKRSVETAKQVQENAIPDLTEKVTQGNIAVSTAALVAKLPKEEQKEMVVKGGFNSCVFIIVFKS